MKLKINGIIMAILISAVFSAVAFAGVSAGSKAPDFTGTDSDGLTRSLSEYKGKYVVLEWLNYECPFVRKHYNSGNMQSLQRHYASKDVIWLSIISSAQGNQGFMTPKQASKFKNVELSQSTALLLDVSGTIGRLYGAKTTPHMFIIDPQGTLVYQGAIDTIATTDPGDIDKAQNYVRSVLDALIAGEEVVPFSTKSYGCSVKY